MMKKTKLTAISRVSVFLLIFGLASALVGCDKWQKMSRSSSEDGAQDNTVVQTEWKNENTTNMSAEKMLPAEKTAASNPVKIEQNNSVLNPDKYVVQIGAFLDRNNADRLVKKLNKKGIPANLIVLEKSVKTWHIVRIGDFDDKTKAVKAAGLYTASENSDSVVMHNGKVVQLVRPDGKMMPADASAPGKGMVRRSAKNDRFTFQVGGLMTKAAAKKQKSKLLKKGYSPYISKISSTINDELWYTVRIGEFFTIDEAANAAAKFAAKEDIPTRADLVMK